MKFEKIKTKDMVLAGVEFAFREEEGKLIELHLRDADGRRYMIKKAGSYQDDIHVLRPAMQKTWTVTGRLGDEDYARVFTDEDDARRHHATLRAGGFSVELLEGDQPLPENVAKASLEDEIPF